MSVLHDYAFVYKRKCVIVLLVHGENEEDRP